MTLVPVLLVGACMFGLSGSEGTQSSVEVSISPGMIDENGNIRLPLWWKALFFFVWALPLSVIGIAPFELAIRWNKIRGVNRLDNVSQLIPLIIALGQLTNVLWLVIKTALDSDPELREEDEDTSRAGECSSVLNPLHEDLVLTLS